MKIEIYRQILKFLIPSLRHIFFPTTPRNDEIRSRFFAKCIDTDVRQNYKKEHGAFWAYNEFIIIKIPCP